VTDPAFEAFLLLHHGLPRQAPGSDASTRRLLELARPYPDRPRVLDLGCGPGRAARLLAAEAGAEVTAVDLHQPFLNELTASAPGIRTLNADMAALPVPDGCADLVWAEGSAYSIGFDTALRAWRRLLAPGGALVLTECEWATDTPSAAARGFWAPLYPLRTGPANEAAARAAGYAVAGVHELPEGDWWDEYYTPILARLEQADTTGPGMAGAVAAERAEIGLRRDHGADYRYRGYVLRPA
jgi:SAM-dependent methyltransferase